MTSTATDRKLLSFERAVTATVVSDVQLSPDGRQVAYATGEASKAGEFPVSTIWLVAADGGQPRRLTTSEGADAAPRWSPDGRRVVFVSDRLKRGTSQLYVLDLETGGEAVRVTDMPGGVVQGQWAPDGTKVAFTAMDPETDEEKRRREERDDRKVVDEDVKRAGLWVVDLPADSAAIDHNQLPEPRRLSPEGAHLGSQWEAGFSWAPDSSRVAVTVSPHPKAHYTFAPEIGILALDGTLTNLGRFESLNAVPKFSPDGATLAFIAAEETIPAMFSLQTLAAGGGEPHVVAPGVEFSFMGFSWLPDGKRVLAAIGERENVDLRIVELANGAVSDAFQPFDHPGVSMLQSLSQDGKRVAFVHATDYSFGEVYVAELGGKPRRLTDLNPWTRDYEFGEVREVKWNSTDGLEIQGLLILPVGYQEGQRVPLLLHIHGGPSAAWTHHLYATWHDWGQFFAQRGYAVLMPNPRGSSGRGTEFLSGITNSYGEPDFDDLMTGVDYVVAQGIADPDRMVVGGWSGGGFLTNWTITHTDRFKAAVSGAGISNWVSFQGTADVRSVFDRYLGRVDEESVETHWRLSPIRYIRNAKTPTLILYGEADFRVPVSQGYELYEGLKSRGVETQLVAYPRQPHAIGERKHQLDLLQRVVDWYDRHLGRD